MKTLLLALLFFLIAPQAHAAIAFKGAGDGGHSAGTSYSNSITVPAGTDLLVIEPVTGGGSAPSAVTVGGIAASHIADCVVSANFGPCGAWYYKSPASGSVTIAVTGTSADTGFVWSAYSGVDQTNPIDSSNAPAKTTTTSYTMSTTVVATNAWLVGVIGNQSSGGSAGAGTTQRTTQTNGTLGGYGVYDSNGTVSTGSQSLVVTQTNQEISGVVFSLTPAAAVSNSFKILLWEF